MSSEWARFLIALEARGVSFEQVQYASDRKCVITAAGITDPLSVAIVETVWQKHCGRGPQGESAGKVAPTPVAELISSSPHLSKKGLLPTPIQVQGTPDYRALDSMPEELQDRIVAAAVLAAALGVGGSLIQYSPTGDNSFIVSSLVPLPMRSFCQSVLSVADAYVVLRKMAESEYLGRSFVAMALGETVSEILTGYAHQISKLQRWSDERAMPLMGVVSEVLRIGHHVVGLRQALPLDLLQPPQMGAGSAVGMGFSDHPGSAPPRSSSGGLNSPRILNHLAEHAQRCAGSQEDSEVLQLLLRRALVPYLRILHRWMHEGVLEDPCGEFFISEAHEPSRPAPTARSNQRRCSVVMELFPEVMADMDMDGLLNSMGGASGGGGLGAPRTNAQLDVLNFERRFSMNKLLIPSFIEKPSRIAKMIFFAGKYCCLLREYSNTRPPFGDAAEQMLVWAGVDALHRMVQESFEISSGAVIQLLFSSSVDLMGHLASLKCYFLQERGDWVVDFLENATDLLARPSAEVKVHSLRVLMQSAIARSGAAAADPYHSLIGCAFADCTLEHCLQEHQQQKCTTKAAPSPTTQPCIQLLQLEADLQWPLTLVLDANIMKRFNRIFRLFIWMKTCERTLASLWYTNEGLAVFATAYGIKHQLTQFLRQFQFYAAHFVLEPLWSRLVSRVNQADSIFSIHNALNDFFDGAEMGLVLSSTTRFANLSHILSLCRRFCELDAHHTTATAPLIEATLHTIQDDFLRALSGLASPIGGDYSQLTPLLTWMDFSGFYERREIYHVHRGTIHGL